MPKETFFNLPADKRQSLVDILLDEFAENSYKNVSVARIVARAGIAKGSFYQYFADKQDCYLYLLQLGIDEKMAFMRQLPPPGQDLDIFATLRWLLDAGTRFEFSSPRLARIGYRAVFDDVPLPDETLALVRQGSQAYFRQLIEQGIAAGVVNPHIDPEIAAFIYSVVFANLGQYLLQRFAIAPQDLLEARGQPFAQEALRTALQQTLAVLEFGLRRPTSNPESV